MIPLHFFCCLCVFLFLCLNGFSRNSRSCPSSWIMTRTPRTLPKQASWYGSTWFALSITTKGAYLVCLAEEMSPFVWTNERQARGRSFCSSLAGNSEREESKTALSGWMASTKQVRTKYREEEREGDGGNIQCVCSTGLWKMDSWQKEEQQREQPGESTISYKVKSWRKWIWIQIH